jgi:hypothetical protein
MTSLEASEGLCYLFPDAVHVVPFSHSTNVTPASGRAIKITANELLSDSRAGIDSAKVAVLHMTDGYDLLGLNKILHHLPKDMQVILAGRSVASVRTARPMPFHTLAQRRPISVGYLTAAGLSNEKPRSKSRHLDEFPSSLSNKLLEVKSKNEALVSLCRSYRVARSTGTAVILCDDPLLRRKINAELQAELSENANPSISQSSTIAVAAGGEASAGSPMTWSGSDWARMQLPGEPMEFLEAYVHPQLRIEGAIPEMVKGRVARADSTIIDVTLSDARRLVLAYALSPSQSVLGAWDTVIIYCGGQTKSYPQWVYAASTAATSLVVVVRAHVRTRERATDWDSSDLLLSTYIS